MKCRICGTENDDYLLYCVMCGARLPKRAEPESVPTHQDDETAPRAAPSHKKAASRGATTRKQPRNKPPKAE